MTCTGCVSMPIWVFPCAFYWFEPNPPLPKGSRTPVQPTNSIRHKPEHIQAHATQQPCTKPQRLPYASASAAGCAAAGQSAGASESRSASEGKRSFNFATFAKLLRCAALSADAEDDEYNTIHAFNCRTAISAEPTLPTVNSRVQRPWS